MLREAFAKAVTDPKFLAEMKNAQIEINYISAEGSRRASTPWPTSCRKSSMMSNT
jgi:hypothetical protein